MGDILGWFVQHGVPALLHGGGHLFERHFTRKHGPDAYYGNPDRMVAAARA